MTKTQAQTATRTLAKTLLRMSNDRGIETGGARLVRPRDRDPGLIGDGDVGRLLALPDFHGAWIVHGSGE